MKPYMNISGKNSTAVKILINKTIVCLFILLVSVFIGEEKLYAEPFLVVDHTAVAEFDNIPDEWIDQVKTKVIQFVGESHSRQVPRGLVLLEEMDSKYEVQFSVSDYITGGARVEDFADSTGLKVERSYYHSQWGWVVASVGDDDYWSTEEGKTTTINTAQRVIDEGHPFFVSIWCWCWDITKPVTFFSGANEFTEQHIGWYNAAIDSFNTLPAINQTKFIYQTSITDGLLDRQWYVGLYNDIMRQKVSDTNGILFDQASIENWNNDDTEQEIKTDSLGRTVYPVHDDYYDDGTDIPPNFKSGHATDPLCIRKAKALWWMLARLSGWDGTTGTSSIEVTSPDGGEPLNAGSSHSITWTCSDVETVKIEYSTNSGSSWDYQITAGVDASTGSYSWTVPDTPSSNCLVRITDVSDPLVTDQSDAVFTITSESISTPTNISGSTDTYTDISESYTASGASSSFGHSLEYRFDWGDGNISDWGNAAQDYAWTSDGTFDIKAQARCQTHTTKESAWSGVLLSVTVSPGGIWGDVDNNDIVNIADALKIATYDAWQPNPENNLALAPIIADIEQCGDVSNDGSINSTDALICATYELYPDNGYDRAGQALGSVPKIASPLSDYTAAPNIVITPAGDENFCIETSVSSQNSILIGTATVIVSWNSDKYDYLSFDPINGNTVVNDMNASDGEVRMVRFDVDGHTTLDFPSINLQRVKTDGNDQFKIEVVNAVEARSFQQLSLDNNTVLIEVGVEALSDNQTAFELSQNVPNPFNPSTAITYTVAEPSYIKLAIYNIQGQQIKTLVDGYTAQGVHAITWDATDDKGMDVSSGIYIYQLSTSNFRGQKSMLLLR